MSNEHSTQAAQLPAGAPFDDTSHLKQQRAIRTRSTILHAAAEAFAQDGFPQVTIKDIADRAEMTKGAVYFHFANKELLAVAVTDEFYRRMQKVIDGALETGDPSLPSTVVDMMRRLAHAFHDDTFVHAGARLQIEQPYIKAKLPIPYVGTLAVLTELLERCSEAGRLPTGSNPAALARALGAAVFGAQHMSWVLNDREDVLERVEEVVEAFIPLHGQHSVTH
ncbi:ScbR family autoregulator-binding transcription factor [Streptomyces lacrimifluminis]|uniref:TetR family transcriptional regulator n=1 Tax=Streptomyces lacrimifluminis TaxID=1500077 RepID=A0A917NXK8_9ACTN|nr:ScbR family autoregulator-binding transcription factor [Streptomyces lacrimifluminis]GGJ38238.1 TetR family transcriptional regulator [Streptomyces lacrimifluminis]